MTENIHLDIIIDQLNWIVTLFKKCGAQIEAKGKLLFYHSYNLQNKL